MSTNMFQLGDTVMIGIRVDIDNVYYEEGKVIENSNDIIVDGDDDRVYTFDSKTLRDPDHEAQLMECKLTESDGGVSYWYWPVDIDEDDYKYFDDKVK